MRRRKFIAGLGAAIGWAAAARAQQSDRMRRVGVLMRFPEDDPVGLSWVRAFRETLEVSGWRDGRNIRIDYRWGPSTFERLRTQAADLLSLKPEVIFTGGAIPLSALQQETRTVPLVFAAVTEPVAGGFVDSMSRPGGNITGFTNFQYAMAGKWLEILKEVAPRILNVGLIQDPLNADWPGYNYAIKAVSSSAGVNVIPSPVGNAGEIEPALLALGQLPQAGLIMLPDVFLASQRELMISLAARHRLPAVYPFLDFAAAGGLVSYGPSFIELFRGAASYVDRVLRGARPEELPVQAPTKFELVINLKAAKAVGLTIPESFLVRADEVIE